MYAAKAGPGAPHGRPPRLPGKQARRRSGSRTPAGPTRPSASRPPACKVRQKASASPPRRLRRHPRPGAPSTQIRPPIRRSRFAGPAHHSRNRNRLQSDPEAEIRRPPDHAHRAPGQVREPALAWRCHPGRITGDRVRGVEADEGAELAPQRFHRRGRRERRGTHLIKTKRSSAIFAISAVDP